MYLLYRLHVAQDQVADVFVERLRRAVELGRQRRPSGGVAVTWSASLGFNAVCGCISSSGCGTRWSSVTNGDRVEVRP